MKTYNDYIRLTPQLFEETPKTVWAAIAISFMLNHECVPAEQLDARLREEWRILNENGIVPQKPNKVTK